MKPRRVLYIVRAVDGGAAVVAHQLARGLDKERYEPAVFFANNRRSHMRQMLVESDIKTIQLCTTRPEQRHYSNNSGKNRNVAGWLETRFSKGASQVYVSLKSFYEFLRNQAPKAMLFVRTIRENGIDLVHTHSDLNNAKSEIIASWMTGVPCVSHVHGYIELSHFDNFFSRFVDAFIYISTDLAEHNITQGKPQDKGVIIYNGVDLEKFAQPYDSDNVRAEFGCTSKNILVGIVGRIDWWKGHEYFLEAVAKVAKRVPGIKGMIIGSLEENVAIELNRLYLEKLHFMVKALGLKENIIFTGHREDVPRLLSALDVVIHASSEPEPFGLVVIEGMAAGKPVIATEAGGVLDIIENGISGLLVTIRDSEAMAQAILQVILNREQAEQMGLAARRRVAERFTVQHQMTTVQKLYDTILGVPR